MDEVIRILEGELSERGLGNARCVYAASASNRYEFDQGQS